MQDYNDSFWTEDMLINNHKSTLNVMKNRHLFPTAASDKYLNQILVAIESALLDKFAGSTKAYLYLTGQDKITG